MSQVMKKIRKSINEKAGKSVAKILTVQGNCEGSLLFLRVGRYSPKSEDWETPKVLQDVEESQDGGMKMKWYILFEYHEHRT